MPGPLDSITLDLDNAKAISEAHDHWLYDDPADDRFDRSDRFDDEE